MGIIIPIMGSTKSTVISGLSSALFGETRQAVLGLLFGHPDERFYQNQIITALGLGSGAVQRELSRLTEAGILTRAVEGHQKYYQANKDCPIFEELRGLTRKTVGTPTIISEALSLIASKIKLAFIYGSVAKGSENKESDIDLMVVSDEIAVLQLSKALTKAQTELRREINPTLYSVEEFSSKIAAKHHFLTSVIRQPKVFLIGDEGELKGMAKKRLADGA